MHKGRLEAFSDGVIAIIITIMVLEIKVPHGSSFTALQPVLPVFLSYILSFIYIGIYWNNHHHMLSSTSKVSGGVLWANLHLLFWLSLTPFASGWMGENSFAPATLAIYGFVLLMSAIAYFILQRLIIAQDGPESILAHAIGKDTKGKLSPVLYCLGIGTSFWNVWIAGGFYVLVALMWLVPDTRIERTLSKTHNGSL
ncbi:TMEM175 family protein [Hymenobacter sp. BT730]|uniref:TMEM175 family protein n=1 Tax=Hymenobacter sp. BT730 TaxID=3063332 RepID=UPI0026DEDCC3|nr:TMEM175 family protein [Hymenobacter sp. BT730]